jgi:DNA mismatch repair protein MSH3
MALQRSYAAQLLLTNSISLCSHFASAGGSAQSSLLTEIIQSVDTRQTILHVRGLQSGIDRVAAEANDLRGAFGGDSARFPEVAQAKDAIVAVEDELKGQLKDIRKVLKRPALSFKSLRLGVNSTLEYLVELPKNTVVPRGWVEVSDFFCLIVDQSIMMYKYVSIVNPCRND